MIFDPIKKSIVFIIQIFILVHSEHTLFAQEIFEFPKSNSSYHKKLQSNTGHQTQITTPYQTIPLQLKYRGEEDRGVDYFNKEEQLKHHIKIADGKFWIDQTLINQDLVKPSPLPAFTSSTPRLAIYVMNHKGQFYLSFKAKKGKIHHSSLLAGRSVACAGEMMIYQGKLYYINNKSGHYQPPPAALRQVLHQLKEKQVDLSIVKVDFLGIDL